MMLFKLTLRGMARGKARFACAVAGVAAACGAVVFMFSLAATNAAQAPELARRACAPWAAWRLDGAFGMGRGRGATAVPEKPLPAAPRGDVELDLVGLQIDYRPGGRVLQGPPMMAVMAGGATSCPYEATQLAEGRWFDDASSDFEVVCTRDTLIRFKQGEPPPLGTAIRFVGRQGTLTAKVVGYLEAAKLPTGWPGVFANRAAFAALSGETHGKIAFYRAMPETAGGESETRRYFSAYSERVVESFKGDETRRMDYATPLLLVAAVLTALCLLVNSLLLAVEANRRVLAVLRTVGLARGGVLAMVTIEALLSTIAGWLLGAGGAVAVLMPYVAADATAFPAGATIAWPAVWSTLALAVVVAFAAVAFALRPALAVRPLDALETRPRRRRRGMTIAFACGFGAFVAVEVWGASLMRGFIPSPEWPDAIVSILPAGVSSFDVEKLRKLPGVKRVSELYPLQLSLYPEVEMTSPRSARKADAPEGGVAPAARGGGGRPQLRNALFLAAEWLPRFRFAEGTWEEADEAIRSSDACVISLMMSRAWNLHRGDKLSVEMGGRGPKTPVELPIAAVVDVNWHMVTSRGLVRGRNGAPMMTDGPVFVSLDTVESLDARPAMTVSMTHLWVEYLPEFLKERGVFQAGREIELSIAEALGLSPSNPENHSTVRLHARDEIADGTLAHGDDVIGQAARVPFVFLAILALGFVAMLVAEADAMKRTFMVLRAVGATRWQLAGRLSGAALRTAAMGVLWGVPAGAAVGWLFTLGTGNWPGMPRYFVLPLPIILEGALGATLFALCVSVPTALFLVVRGRRSRIL